MKKVPAGLGLALLGIVLALGAGEVLLRLFRHPPARVSGWVCTSSVIDLERNQLGFRGHPIDYSDSTTVIVLVGDSQVEATHLAWDWMPECRLEQHLEDSLARDIEVISIAAQGYGQDQQLLALEYFFRDFRADFVVVWETPGNDLWNNTFPTHWPANGWLKPTFWLEDGRLQGPSQQLGEVLPEPRLALLSLFESVFSSEDRDGDWEERLPPPYVPDSVWDGEVLMDWQERWETNLGLMRDENLVTEKSHLAVYLTPRSPRMQYSIDLTRALLGRIDSLSQSHGALLVVFATEDPPDPTGSPEQATYLLNGSYYHVSGSQYLRNVRDANEGLTFWEIPIQVERWRMGPANSHLNEHATDLLMSDLACRLAPLVAERNPAR